MAWLKEADKEQGKFAKFDVIKMVQPWGEDGADPNNLQDMGVVLNGFKEFANAEAVIEHVKSQLALDGPFEPVDDEPGRYDFDQIEDDDGSENPNGKWLADYSIYIKWYTPAKASKKTAAEIVSMKPEDVPENLWSYINDIGWFMKHPDETTIEFEVLDDGAINVRAIDPSWPAGQNITVIESGESMYGVAQGLFGKQATITADAVPPQPPQESAAPGMKWAVDPQTKQWVQVPESAQTDPMATEQTNATSPSMSQSFSVSTASLKEYDLF